MKKNKTLIIISVVAILCVLWGTFRTVSTVPGDLYVLDYDIPYSEDDRVMRAISLSYLVYGCENAADLSGDVSSIIDKNTMGIISENFGLIREDESNPDTTKIDTAEFIKTYVGSYRFLTDIRDPESSFCGVAFCDDEEKIVWISYAGSVDFADGLASAGIVFDPLFTRQEKSAFALFRKALSSEEVSQKGYNIILTGHSLGGALATEVSLVSNCPAITINGADGVSYDKICSMDLKNYKDNKISNYMTSTKNGTTSFMDFLQSLMFVGSYKSVDYHIYHQNDIAGDPHCAFSFIEIKNGEYCLPSELK